MNLAEVIAGLRATGTEFEDVGVKRAAGGVPESLASTLAALANARGGIVILGLNEQEGFAASGVPNAAATRDAVVSIAREKLTPYGIDRLRENAGQPRWDEEPVPQATAQDLNRDTLSRLIENARRQSPRVFGSADELDALAMLGVMVRHEGTFVPSMAGLLSVGRYPQQFFPQLMVSVAVYPHVERGRSGPGGIRFLDSAALGGAIPDMVVDRDYSPQARGTQIQVDVFPDRVEISNPGGLFGNVRLEGLGESGTSSSRNPRLAALLQETGDPVTGRPVAENRGSGVSMMIDRVRQDIGVVPLFTAGDTAPQRGAKRTGRSRDARLAAFTQGSR